MAVSLLTESTQEKVSTIRVHSLAKVRINSIRRKENTFLLMVKVPMAKIKENTFLLMERMSIVPMEKPRWEIGASEPFHIVRPTIRSMRCALNARLDKQSTMTNNVVVTALRRARTTHAKPVKKDFIKTIMQLVRHTIVSLQPIIILVHLAILRLNSMTINSVKLNIALYLKPTKIVKSVKKVLK